MKPRVLPIIIDDTFGFGSRFSLVDVEVTDKVILRNGVRTYRSGFRAWAPATQALAREMREVNELADQLQERARKLREKLNKDPKAINDTNSKPAPTAAQKKQFRDLDHARMSELSKKILL